MRKLRFAMLAWCMLIAVNIAMARPDRSAPIRVMTYNLRYDNPDDGQDNWKFRKEFILSTFRFYKVDLIGIQEGLSHQVKYLSDSLPDFDWCGVGRDDGKTAGEYSAIFFNKHRFELIDHGNFWLSPTPDVPSKGWDAACIRIATWAKLHDRKSNTTFLYVNTHFDHIGGVARENSAKLIRSKITSLTSDRMPVMLSGDFNSCDTDSSYITLVRTDLNDSRYLIDSKSLSATGHHGPLATFCGFDVIKNYNKERIDFIFVSPGIAVKSHGTLTDFKDNLHFPSDHLPVLAEVVLPCFVTKFEY